MTSPFPPTTTTPGNGTVLLAHIPPSSSTLRDLTYQYPLKLVAPSPLLSPDDTSTAVQTLYLLTYGGGLVAGDSITLSARLEHDTRLILLTQGSTKIFRSPALDVVSRQVMHVNIDEGAALCYLPEPVQPFEGSAFEQRQSYEIAYSLDEGGKIKGAGSLCALDWVSEGRRARGEKWKVWGYASRNEVWARQSGGAHQERGNKKLLLRDNLMLDFHKQGLANGLSNGVDCHGHELPDFSSRMDDLGVFGTLILHGPMFAKLGAYFMDEFKCLPRIGGRKWDLADDEPEKDEKELRRKARQHRETVDGLLWTVSSLRSCVVVKFGAKEVEGGKRWLSWMLEAEGSVPLHFGERALLCLR